MNPNFEESPKLTYELYGLGPLLPLTPAGAEYCGNNQQVKKIRFFGPILFIMVYR